MTLVVMAFSSWNRRNGVYASGPHLRATRPCSLGIPHSGNARRVGEIDIGTMSDTVRRYGIAVLASGLGLAAVYLLGEILPFEPFLLFAVPVALTSRYAGRGPTVLSVVLTVLAIEVTLVFSRGRFRFTDAELWVHAAIFGIVALTIDSTTEALRRARRAAERAANHLEDLNVELEQQMEQI